jgi:hypothetical protein
MPASAGRNTTGSGIDLSLDASAACVVLREEAGSDATSGECPHRTKWAALDPGRRGSPLQAQAWPDRRSNSPGHRRVTHPYRAAGRRAHPDRLRWVHRRTGPPRTHSRHRRPTHPFRYRYKKVSRCPCSVGPGPRPEALRSRPVVRAQRCMCHCGHRDVRWRSSPARQLRHAAKSDSIVDSRSDGGRRATDHDAITAASPASVRRISSGFDARPGHGSP